MHVNSEVNSNTSTRRADGNVSSIALIKNILENIHNTRLILQNFFYYVIFLEKNGK